MSENMSVEDVLTEHLKDIAYTCSRVWVAWQYGTMTEDDFTPAEQDDDFMSSLVEAIESLITERERAARIDELQSLHSDIVESPKYLSDITDQAFAYGRVHRLIDDRITALQHPSPSEETK